jgi:flagellar basal body P-ring formation protein FlgA
MRKFGGQYTFRARFRHLIGFAGVMLCSSGAIASSSNFHSSQEIRETAKIFLEKMTTAADNSNIEINVNDLDPRLKLKKCSDKLQTELSRGSKMNGKVTVLVACQQPVAWKIFISADIVEYADVIVAARAIPRKTTITAKDIEQKRVDIAKLRKSPIFNQNLVVGSTTKRNINKGKLVYADSICMVCRGDNVQITAKSKYFSINMDAVALSDASIGETTLVRNKQSKRSFSAKVVSRDRLEVTL